MTRRTAALIAVVLAGAVAPEARAELPDEGVANGRFMEMVSFGEGGALSASMSDEPGQPGVATSIYVNDHASGFWAYGDGQVPAPLASLSADHATASFDLAELPGFFVFGCGFTDGTFGCGQVTSGRVELTVVRSGEPERENGTSRLDLPDGSTRRVTRAGWTAPASVEGALLGAAIPAGALAKIGSYHLLVVSKTPAK